MGFPLDQPPPEPLASAEGFLLSYNGHRMATRFAAALEPLGLRPPQFGVLRLIDAEPGSTQQQLVERSMIDASSMVAIIDELEEAGLAERRTHSSDRRKHAIHLTQRGRRLLAKALDVAEANASEMLASLDERERKTLKRLLRKLAGVED